MVRRGVLDEIVDLVLPRRCVQCAAAGAWLCDACAGGLRPLPLERCPRCGAPGPWTPSGAVGRRIREARRPAELAMAHASAGPPPSGVRAPRWCPECRGRDLAFVCATAAFTYEGAARSLVTACKFRELRSVGSEMARRAAPAFVTDAQLVTCVPGHRERSLARGFNQAELLARDLAREVGLPYAPLLRRVRQGSRQSGLGRGLRTANVRGAFALRGDAKRVLHKLKKVVIVDDVYTTGETVDQSARVLSRAGFEPHVFTFARTVRALPTQASLDHAVQKERCR